MWGRGGLKWRRRDTPNLRAEGGTAHEAEAEAGADVVTAAAGQGQDRMSLPISGAKGAAGTTSSHVCFCLISLVFLVVIR